jgi:hypothetical protein
LSPEDKPATKKCERGKQFDEEIANGNWRAAIFAFAAEIKPRNQWDVQVKRNRIFAMGTMRGWGNDAFI